MNWLCDQNSFLAWESRSRDTIEVKRCYVDVAGGDLIAGILLSQIIYWHLPDHSGQPRLRIERDGYKWLAKKRDDWWKECRITPRQFDLATKLLQSKSLIKTATYKFGNSPIKHIRIDWENFLNELQLVVQNPPLSPERNKTALNRSDQNGNLAKCQNPTLQNGELELPKMSNLKLTFCQNDLIDTEITSKIPSEITTHTTSTSDSETEKQQPYREEESVKKVEILQVEIPKEKEHGQESNFSLLKKSKSSSQIDKPSRRHNTAASFDKSEQSNIARQQDPFLNNRTFIPAKGTYKSSSTDPWMLSANIPNEEFAQWLFDKRYKHLSGKMISDAKAEIRNNFERAADLWKEYLAEKSPQKLENPDDNSLVGYYYNRADCWHKSTFCELLDRVEVVGANRAIAEFSNRYDQQDTGATQKWLSWLESNHPKMYAHLYHQQAA